MAVIRRMSPGRSFMGNLTRGADMLDGLTEVCRTGGVAHGSVQAIGALYGARLGYFNAEDKAYEYIEVGQHVEIVSLMGNISLLEGRPFIHAHLAVGDREGRVWGGHLAQGCRVYVCEYVIQELAAADQVLGESLQRRQDPASGLMLWLD